MARRDGCQGMVSYPNRAAAQAARQGLRAKRAHVRRQRAKAEGRPMEVFACAHCGGFHVGHQLQSGKRSYNAEVKLRRYRELTEGEA